MRVIAGKARHLPLKTLDGLQTRPTTDRIKETLFNMIQPEIPGSCFLDLFAGSGAIGIEALSRGAEQAVFVESDRRAAACIRENLAFTHLENQAEVLQRDVFSALAFMSGRKAFDVIFMDPPYRKNLEFRVLEELRESSLADADTLIIVEAALETDFGIAESLGYELFKYKKYKTNAHAFLRRRAGALRQ